MRACRLCEQPTEEMGNGYSKYAHIRCVRIWRERESEMNDPIKVFKVTLCIVDHDKLGADEIKRVIENTKYPNWCISPHVTAMDTRTIEWSDRHPLNITATSKETFEQLFSEGE